MNKLALYCRIGFEKEVAAEITDRASERGVFGFARVVENSGYVIFECYQPGDADRLAREIPFNRLIFARQMIVVSDLLENLILKIVFRQFWLNMNALQKTLILSKR